MKIVAIFETHRNEDYVIGSLELSNLTGAKIFHGSQLNFEYGEPIADEEKFDFGNLRINALYTPGHTIEHMSYSLTDLSSGSEPIMVFTGDALFIGDVGRTDFYEPQLHRKNAESLYESIHNKLLPLGDGVIVYPAHGAGSVCGGNISKREYSTLGLERLQNQLLRLNKNDFIDLKLSEHHEKPPYFKKMEELNLKGAPLLNFFPNPPPLEVQEFNDDMKRGSIVIDTRSPPSFNSVYIKNSYNMWLERLPNYVGWFLPYDKPLLLVLESDYDLELTVRHLIRLGYDNIAGYLKGGIGNWYKTALNTEKNFQLSIQELKERLDKKNELFVLDVRDKREWENGHIKGASYIFYGELENRIQELETKKPIAVVCNTGNRSSLIVSILRRAEFNEVYNVTGGMTAWDNANYPTTVD